MTERVIIIFGYDEQKSQQISRIIIEDVKLTENILQLLLHGDPDGGVHDGVDERVEERVCVT